MEILKVGDAAYPQFQSAEDKVTAVTEILRKDNDFKSVSKNSSMQSGHVPPHRAALAVKRGMDVAIGLAGTVAFLAAYPFLALLIKLESPGPALYAQVRVGLDQRRQRRGSLASAAQRRQATRMGAPRRNQDVGGKPFQIRKFRTMRADAEAQGPQLCEKGGDPRVTRVGRFLRSTHLDELPQFWNVLKGEMSFIGPRPERPHFTLRYFEHIPMYRERTRHVKPGITGLSQITLGYDDTLESVERKTHFDLAYRQSLAGLKAWFKMEGWILVNTIRYLLNRKPLVETEFTLPADVAASLESEPGSRPHLTMALVRHRGQIRSTVVVTQSPEKSLENTPVSDERIANFMTVDVEAWFHAHNLGVQRSAWDALPARVDQNVGRILDLLEKTETRATFFVLGWVADRYPDLVRRIAEAGHEIGTHGYSHRLITEMSPYQFEKDLDQSLNALGRIVAQPIHGHRASNFSVVKSTLWSLEILARYGITYDSSIFPVTRKRYGIGDYPNPQPHRIQLESGATLTEVPMSTLRFAGRGLPIAGGGYLRLYPRVATESFMAHRNRQGLPGMVYIHPWELDLEQPKVKTSRLNAFLHTVNMDTTEEKLSRLMGNFRFESVRAGLETQANRELLDQNPVRIRSLGLHAAETVPVLARKKPSGRRLLSDEAFTENAVASLVKAVRTLAA